MPSVIIDNAAYPMVADPTHRDDSKVRCSFFIDLDVDPDDLAFNICRYRSAAGLTQKQLAAALGVGHRTVSTWEANTQGRAGHMPLDLLYQTALLLGIQFERLLEKGPRRDT